MIYLALTVAFLIELIAFASFAGSAFLLSVARPLQISLSIFLLVALIIFWGVYMSPRASRKLAIAKYYVAKAIIYVIAAYSLLRLTNGDYFVIFVLAVVIDEIVLFKHNLKTLK